MATRVVRAVLAGGLIDLPGSVTSKRYARDGD